MALASTSTPLVLGRGRLFLTQCEPNQDILTSNNFLFIGNAPEFSINIESDVLDHYQSTGGTREKDESVDIQVNRSANIVVDGIDANNLARFFFGSSSVLTQVASTVTAEPVTADSQNVFIQLGKGDTNPTGFRGIANVVVTDSTAATTYVENADYIVNSQTGTIEIVETGDIALAGPEDLLVTYDVLAQTRNRVLSSNVAQRGALQYVEDNARGEDKVFTMPNTIIRPDGDFNLISDEWQTLPFNLDILTLPNAEAIYVDGSPF